ncbi:MAG: prepilin-type N-terminal cleavage/methylation domain-containing protein [Microgenomates group bacterium]
MFKKAFTLIELLVVIAIIAILISVGSVSYTRSLKLSRDSKRRTDLEQIRQALETYRSENGVYPASATWQSALTAGGAYISTIPTDPKEDGIAFSYTYALGATDTLYTLCATTLETTGLQHCVSQP